MRLNVIGSSSEGNAYVLQNGDEALLLEAGMHWSDIRKALGWNTRQVQGCLITHEHGDHAGHADEMMRDGIPVYCSQGTAEGMRYRDQRRPRIIRAGEELQLGRFRILPFATKHDSAEPLGFYINHPETGNILFATDTYYLPHTFRDLNQVMIECNYRMDILQDNIQQGIIPQPVAKRTLESHMSYAHCVDTLTANDLTRVRNIILLHLSHDNSDPDAFTRGIREATGCRTIVATPGLETELNAKPF